VTFQYEELAPVVGVSRILDSLSHPVPDHISPFTA